jgi:EAL domain-containing protein (putative c-di-GMP-specific phosphodiesterase class I)
LQCKRWQQSKDYDHTYIGINLSGLHLIKTNQLAQLMALISANIVEPERLIFGFNEPACSRHIEPALKGLQKLKEFGVKLALDDYGASLSSLNFLHNYLFEFIKLVRSFIYTLNYNDKNVSLIKVLHELGIKFSYQLVAEGIESGAMFKKL